MQNIKLIKIDMAHCTLYCTTHIRGGGFWGGGLRIYLMFFLNEGQYFLGNYTHRKPMEKGGDGRRVPMAIVSLSAEEGGGGWRPERTDPTAS
jgi:hypothetical protein